MTQTKSPLEIERAASALPRGASQRGWETRLAWFQRRHLLTALAGYIVLTLFFTFPAIFHLGDVILGPLPASANDNFWYVWYSWAFRQAVSKGQDPAFTHLIYALYPRVQLFAASYVSGSLGSLLLFVLSPLAAYNILVLLGFVLSGFTMYLLANAFLPNRWACFIVGFLYTFSTFHFWHATGQLDLATMQWLPLAAWRVFAFYRQPGWRNAIWMGLSVALIPLSDLYLAAYFLVPFALLFVGGLLLFHREWLARPRHLLLAGFALAITLALTLPFLASSLRVDPAMRAAIALKATSADTYSANLIAYFLPHPANPFFGQITAHFYQHIPSMQYPIEQSIYLGWVALTLAAIPILFGRVPPRAAYFWLALAVGAFLLSLGPTLQIGGHALVHLPFYDWLYGWPILANFRAPNRLGPVVLLGICMLAGYGLTRLFDATPDWLGAHGAVLWRIVWRIVWRARATAQAEEQAGAAVRHTSRITVVALGMLVMLGSLAENIQFGFPYPSTPVQVPSVYAAMAADPVPGLVLTLPVYFRGSDMFYQTVHQRNIVGGYPIRASYPMIESIENVPYLSDFDWANSAAAGDPSADLEGRLHDIFPLTETFAQGLQDNGIRYVVLQQETFPPVEPWMRPFLLSHLGTPFYDSAAAAITVWRIAPGKADPNQYRFKLGSGWRPGLRVLNNQVIRIVLQDAQLDINAPRTAPQDLLLTASATVAPRIMVVSLNGAVITTIHFAQPDVTQIVDLGPVLLNAGHNTLELKSAQPCATPDPGIPPTLDPNCGAFNVVQLQMSALNQTP